MVSSSLSSPIFNIVVPDKEAVADATALVVHLTDAEVYITRNTTEVAYLGVAYPATTSWMLTLALLTRLLRADPTGPIVDFAQPEEGLVLPNIDKPLCFCKPRPPNVTVTGHRSVLRDKQLGQFHAKCQGTTPQVTSLLRSFDKTLHNVSIVHTELNGMV